jgi:hypothetical protein
MAYQYGNLVPGFIPETLAQGTPVAQYKVDPTFGQIEFITGSGGSQLLSKPYLFFQMGRPKGAANGGARAPASVNE